MSGLAMSKLAADRQRASLCHGANRRPSARPGLSTCHRPSSSRARRGIDRGTLVQLLAVAWLSLASVGLAQSPGFASAPDAAGPPPLIRRLFVPADAPDRWPRGDWEPFPADRFDRLLQAAQQRQSAPAPPPFRSATYVATVAGTQLVAGQVTWQLAEPPPPRGSGTLLAIGRSELPLFDLQARTPAGDVIGRELPWGRAEEGQLWLLAPAQAASISARFALDGRQVGQVRHWKLRLPRSLRSRVELRVPNGLRLAASCGLVAGPLPLPVGPPLPPPEAAASLPTATPPPAAQSSEPAADSLWQIELGGHTECDLQLFPQLAPPASGVLLVRPELSLVVRPEATRFRAAFDLIAGEHPRSQVEFELPPHAEIAAVRWGDEWLEWDRPAENRARLRVHFSDPLLGESRRVELQGLLPADDSRDWNLPLIKVVDAVEQEGSVVVRTLAPFRLARWQAEGLRGTGYQASPDGAETFEFVRVTPDARLTFEPEVAAEQVTIRQIDVLGSSSDDDLVVCLEWSVRDGQVWSADLSLTPGWEVVDVRALSAGRGDRGLDWQVTPTGEGGRLTCQFAEALTPNRPITAEVTLRVRNTPESGLARLPAVIPSGDGASSYSLLAVGAVPPAVASGVNAFQPLPLQELPDWIEPLGLASRTEPAVWRLPGVAPQSPVQLVPPRLAAMSEPVGAPPATAPGTELASVSASASGEPPRAFPRVDIVVDLAGGSVGFDHYRLEFELPPGWPSGPIAWQFAPRVQDLVCFLNNRPAIPPSEIPGYHAGILVPPAVPQEVSLPRRLRVEYRVPLDEATPGRRTLLFPRLDLPVLESAATLRVAPGQVLLTPPPGFVQRQPLAGDAPQPLRPLLGRWLEPQTRTVATPWWLPFQSESWRDLFRQIEGPTDLEDPLDLAEQWQCRQLGLPEQLPLEVARRDATLTSGLLLLGLGVVLTLVARHFAHNAHPAWVAVALLLLGCGLLWWSGGRAQALVAVATGLLLGLCWPERWRRPQGAASVLPDRPGLPPLPATVGLLIAAFLGLLALGGSLAWSQSPALPPAPAGALGDVLIPLAAPGAPPQATPLVYLSPTLRQELEALASPPRPGVLVQTLDLETPLDGQGRQLLVARLECWLTGHGPARLLLPLEGVRLAENNPCLVDGRPADLLPIANSSALLLELDAGLPLSSTLTPADADSSRLAEGAASTPAESAEISPADSPDRPAAPFVPDEGCGPAGPAIAGEVGPPGEANSLPAPRRVEVVLRLFPIPAVVGEPETRLRLPPAGVTRLPPEMAGASGELIPPDEFTGWATSPEARLVGDLAAGWMWRTAPADPAVISTPLRLTETVKVELQGQVALMQAEVRCRPGAQPCAGVGFQLPAGLTLLNVTTDVPIQVLLIPQPDGERRLEVQFVPAVREPVTLELELVQVLPEGEFELRLPEPVESWPTTGMPGLLAECRLGVLPPPDRQLTVRPAIADLPLRAWINPPSDWVAGWRDAGQQFAYELDLPRRVLLQLEPRSPVIEAQLEQRGELVGNRIEWRWRAEQVRTQQPLFQYDLTVDPRLEITQVEVLHEQTSQLQRWSRTGDRVTLFLMSASEPGETIEVRGTLPLADGVAGGLPLVRLEHAAARIERRVLLADPALPARLDDSNWVETQVGGQRVLFDAPVPPQAEWPRLESTTREEPDRPAAPSEPEAVTPTGTETATTAIAGQIAEVELAEVVLQESADGHSPGEASLNGRLTLWLPPGEGGHWELHWPAGAELRGLDWQGEGLSAREAPGVLTVLLPQRNTAGRLVLHWHAPRERSQPGVAGWASRSAVAIAWPRQTRVARVLFTTGTPSLAGWRLGGTLRGLPAEEAARLIRETNQRLAIERPSEAGFGELGVDPTANWLLGNARLTQEVQRTGVWTNGLGWGGSAWPQRGTALLLAGLGGVVGLTRRWWLLLQGQTAAAVCVLGCLVWVGLSGTPWGGLLALGAIPFLLVAPASPAR